MTAIGGLGQGFHRGLGVVWGGGRHWRGGVRPQDTATFTVQATQNKEYTFLYTVYDLRGVS